MSDELVKRLRAWSIDAQLGNPCDGADMDLREAAYRIEALQAERDKYRKALEEESDWDCSCDPAYYERGLRAPDCMAALVGDDVREVLGMAPLCRANVANRKAKR